MMQCHGLQLPVYVLNQSKSLEVKQRYFCQLLIAPATALPRICIQPITLFILPHSTPNYHQCKRKFHILIADSSEAFSCPFASSPYFCLSCLTGPNMWPYVYSTFPIFFYSSDKISLVSALLAMVQS